ncbi:MAG: ABC transporter substrate-binding protein [Cyanobacteria bacterium]|nr:ABC transporter substrate-binding protein [Cyanobacteria bacterium CG_2015-16_32_12]NCO77553.1 ABC transporter substrate-binding protein [Cyanobacteria bacterium CG_2015-22_32_23]NCQ03462.1 ABC transporter substrate-binding protein [Cyanobacteria bacterium CG_2015-09_32_10]NCQ40873.1 ABC transporter substrate-binding protein [Cyanobacteria bacterium CG_2015-04_32_10]NCS84808.1 ABC transporter substrate-binding protein [Cyanobacteria bacterium CG_2015-02_32_10]
MDRLTQKFLSILKIPSSSEAIISSNNQDNYSVNKAISVGIILASLGITYLLPIFGLKNTVTIVSGSELKEVLEEIEKKFEEKNPNINLDLKFQGSQDIINNYTEEKNDFKPTILLPANSELITELETQLKAQGETDIFYDTPKAIAKTMLVAIAWEERGKVLFPDNKFNWQKLETALQTKNWDKLGGKKEWGSFDFITTDPTRSNSGQLTLNLWAKSQLNQNNLTLNDVNNPKISTLFQLIKNSVYQPPRSTDILLQEFIARGKNDADVATVYESIALHRWLQAKENQKQGYQIYYPNPTIETTIMGAIVKKNISKSEAKAGKKFIDFLTENEQQIIFAKYGFRPMINLDLKSLPNTPWNQNIQGVEINPSTKINSSPNPEIMNEIQKIWYRS